MQAAYRKMIQAARSGEGQQPAAMREDICYTKMMVSIFAVFLLSYALHHQQHHLDYPSAKDSSCINPVLYFRQAYSKIYKDVKGLISVGLQG